MNMYARPSVASAVFPRYASTVFPSWTKITHSVVNAGDARTSFARWLEAHGPRLHPNREPKIITNIFNNTITLNGGSLGSWVDEERS